MKEINFFKKIYVISLFIFTFNNLEAETIILSSCDNKKDGFLKNEYILDLEQIFND